MSNNYNYLFKYIIIGDSSVGKSNILMRYSENQFTEEHQATLGAEFGAKNIEFNKLVYRLQIWDTAGQENFRSITRAYYKNSVCAIVVYDITNRQSFMNVQDWIDDVRSQSPKTVFIVLVGNKIDLEDKRKVTFNEGSKFASKNGLMFMEASAKTGKGIEDVFKKSATEIAKKMSEGYYALTSDTCGIKRGKSDLIQLKIKKRNSIKNFAVKKCC